MWRDGCGVCTDFCVVVCVYVQVCSRVCVVFTVCVRCVWCVLRVRVCDNGGCPQRQMCVSRFLSGNIVQHRHELFSITLCSHIFFTAPMLELGRVREDG